MSCSYPQQLHAEINMHQIYQELAMFYREQPELSYLFLFLFGSAIGSFLNVAAFRMPIGIKHGFIQNAIDIIEHFKLGEHSISDGTEKRHRALDGRSHCPSCLNQIPIYHNIPVFSWFILQGKCISCGSKISFRYPLIEFICGAVFTSLIHFSGLEFGVYMFAILCLLYVIASCDYEISVIPQGPVLIIALIALLMTCRGGEVTTIDALTISMACYAILTLFGRYFAFGHGDIILYSALSMVAGQKSLWLFVCAGLAAIMLYLITRKKVSVAIISDKQLVQYGPAIAISGAIVMISIYMLR